jgi:hypothetical protein
MAQDAERRAIGFELVTLVELAESVLISRLGLGDKPAFVILQVRASRDVRRSVYDVSRELKIHCAHCLLLPISHCIDYQRPM